MATARTSGVSGLSGQVRSEAWCWQKAVETKSKTSIITMPRGFSVGVTQQQLPESCMAGVCRRVRMQATPLSRTSYAEQLSHAKPNRTNNQTSQAAKATSACRSKFSAGMVSQPVSKFIYLGGQHQKTTLQPRRSLHMYLLGERRVEAVCTCHCPQTSIWIRATTCISNLLLQCSAGSRSEWMCMHTLLPRGDSLDKQAHARMHMQ